MRRAKKEAKNPRWRWLAPCGVVACVLLAFANSLSGPFIYDDLDAIRNNPDFGGQTAAVSPTGKTLTPVMVGEPPASTTLTNRPFLWFSFYLNYLVDGRDERGILNVGIFHATNLLVHIFSSLLIYGIVRRTLLLKFWNGKFNSASSWLAAAIAAIWAVHPLNTESVTYIVQRAESMAGMFYLAVVYCLIRSATGEHKQHWHWDLAAVAACILGVMTKETVATAPVVALIYDRTFLAGSFAAALRARWKLYLGLLISWPLIIGLIVAGGGRGHSVGFGNGISSMEYARTQLGAIAHYLLLTVWPARLTLSLLDWPVAKNWSDVGPAGILVALLVVLWVFSLWKRPVLGFLGAWFFLILAPSSSFIPIASEKVSEHRMYLSLAAPVALLVVGGWIVAGKFKLKPVAIALGAILFAALAVVTIIRNNEYRTSVGIWTDNVEKRPDNAQAQYHLGYAWFEVEWPFPPGSPQKQFAATQAAMHIQKAYDLLPGDAIAQLLGHLLIDSGQPAAAEKFLDEVVDKYPGIAFESHMMRGQLRGERGDYADAQSDFQAAIQANPKSEVAHFLSGFSMEKLGDRDGAKAEFQRALDLKPGYPDAMLELNRVSGK